MSERPPLSEPRAVNRRAWDARTAVHLDSEFYDAEGFRRGQLSLKPPELELVGDPRGRSLLHLQCHFGLDTLSWARLGARVTGVDLSPASVSAADDLARATGLGAKFVCADVQDLGPLGEPFDVVFASYGVVCWLDDLDAWADTIQVNLRAGGRFVMVEFHPVLELLYPGKVSGSNRYFGRRRAEEARTDGTYTDPAARLDYPEYRWQHPLGEVVSALRGSGLDIVDLREYEYCSYRLVDDLTGFDGGVWHSDEPGRVPYMYSIVATVRP